MALVTRIAGASGDTNQLKKCPHITGLMTGEAIDGGAPCYIDSTTGSIFMCDGTAADQKAVIAGWAPRDAILGEPLTLFGIGARFSYSSGTLTPGQKLYLGTTKGRLDTAATTGDAVGAAQAVNTTDIRATRNI